MGRCLQPTGLSVAILDSAASIGAAWTNRWDSLRLFSPARYSSLRDLPFPAPPGALPGKDDVAAYLRLYAAEFELPVRLGQRVRAVDRLDDGYAVATDGAQYRAANVVVATGPFQEPAIPPFAAELAPEVLQLHSSSYRNPEQLPPGDVVVVGALASGCQIAEELSETRTVHLSVGRAPSFAAPRRILGKHPFWWADHLGFFDQTIDSSAGRRSSRQPEVIIGPGPRQLSRRRGVHLSSRAIGSFDGALSFADGRSLTAQSVVWATGYRPDYGFLHVPVLDEAGRPVHRRGVTASPGLFFLGLPWLHSRGSALLGWVSRDAQYLADQIRRVRSP